MLPVTINQNYYMIKEIFVRYVMRKGKSFIMMGAYSTGKTYVYT
ncbi:gluconate kinase, partial [Rodentibacter pneumotropicus]